MQECGRAYIKKVNKTQFVAFSAGVSGPISIFITAKPFRRKVKESL